MVSALSTSSFKSVSRGFLISAGLHIIAGTLLFGMAIHSPLPLGSRLRGSPMVVELAGQTRPVAVAPKIVKPVMKPKPKLTGDVPIAAPKTETPVAQPSPQEKFGTADGNAGEGSLGVENGVDASKLDRYLYELRVLIAHRKTYPAASKRLGETGRVIVKFDIDRDGRIEQPGLRSASPYSRLNEAALQLVSQIERYKPIPEGHSGSKLSVEVPIDYVLN